MKKTPFYLFFLLFLAACMPNMNKQLQLEWQPEFLGPIAFARLTPDQFAESVEPAGKYDFFANQLGIPSFQTGVNITVPPLGPLNLPPKYESISGMIRTLEAEEAIFTLSFYNNMPINIKAGTHIVAFDSATQDIIFDHILDRDVAAGDSYRNEEIAKNKTLTSSWGMQVRDFQSDGGSGIFSADPVTVNYGLKIVRFLKATLNPDELFSFGIDTNVDFAIADSIQNNDSLQISDIHGYLSLFFENKLPADVRIRLNLLNDQNDTLYRFFNGQEAFIAPADIDAQGNTVAMIPTDFPQLVSLDTLQQMGDVTRLVGYLKVHSADINAFPVVDVDNYFKIKLAAKLGFTMDITQ